VKHLEKKMTNTNTIEKNWTELKGKIKTKWGKFNDEEVEGFKSDLNLLAGKLQKTYGIAKEQADHQFEEFRKSVHLLLDPGPTLVPVEPSKSSMIAGPQAAKVHQVKEVKAG
jgi:uncharacterized protein YjbJ (UPF0337 family)